MQGNVDCKDKNQDKVVSIFAARRKQLEPNGKKADTDPNASFDDIMRRNAENLDRIRRERLQSNKGVLKSYRLKD
jgi:hypothetical protein